MEKSKKTILLNSEVAQILKSGISKFRYSKEGKKSIEKLKGFLEDAGKLDMKTQERLAKDLNKYELTSFEKIQILNILPSNEVVLSLLVENCLERFSKTQIDEIILLIGGLKQ